MVDVKEVFSQFCKERHTEDKGRNYDFLQEIYASTEFFDLSLYNFEGEVLHGFSIVHDEYVGIFPYKEVSLPFPNCFLKLKEHIFLYLREYSPEIITGTLYTTDYTQEIPAYANIKGTLNCPFTIRVKDGVISSNIKIPLIENNMYTLVENVFKVVLQSCDILNNLSHKAVAVDKPKNPNLCEYYRRKRKPTIKIPQRPIYYVLGDRNENTEHKFRNIRTIGELEYSHCFSVRGHWRRVNEGTFGKDRNGNYNVKGYTWVTEYVKGEGELSKRLRVIK